MEEPPTPGSDRRSVEITGSFGEWLKAEREARGLTQTALGKLVAYSGDHIRRTEKGERRFETERARQLADYLELPPDEYPAFIDWAGGGPAPRSLTLPSRPAVQAPRRTAQRSTTPSGPAALGNDDTGSVSVRQRRWWRRLSRRALLSVIIVLLIGTGLLIARTLLDLGWRVGPDSAPAQSGSAGEQRTRLATDTIRPGGLWIRPMQQERFEVTDDRPIQFAARAYPTSPRDPAIDRVEFTVSWPATGWTIACIARQPTEPDVYTCRWTPSEDRSWPDLSQPFEQDVRVAFNVYDRAGNHNNAPHGVRTISISFRPS